MRETFLQSRLEHQVRPLRVVLGAISENAPFEREITHPDLSVHPNLLQYRFGSSPQLLCQLHLKCILVRCSDNTRGPEVDTLVLVCIGTNRGCGGREHGVESSISWRDEKVFAQPHIKRAKSTTRPLSKSSISLYDSKGEFQSNTATRRTYPY